MRSFLLSLFLVSVPSLAAPAWSTGQSQVVWQAPCTRLPAGPRMALSAEAGFLADPAELPQAADVYYVAVTLTVGGQDCSVPPSATVELVAPPGTVPSISVDTPVRCDLRDTVLVNGVAHSVPVPLRPADCPQALVPGLFGPALAVQYSLAFGQELRIQVPVMSKQGVSPAAPVGERVRFAVQSVTSPPTWSFVDAPVAVRDRLPSFHDEALVTDTLEKTRADVRATVATVYRAGTVRFEYGKTTQYELGAWTAQVPQDAFEHVLTAGLVGLDEGTRYHWRARFDWAAGSAVGLDHTFTTAGQAPVSPPVQGEVLGEALPGTLDTSGAAGSTAAPEPHGGSAAPRSPVRRMEAESTGGCSAAPAELLWAAALLALARFCPRRSSSSSARGRR